MPEMQKRYRIEISQKRWAMAGSSLGGLLSCYAGWTRSQVYGRVACMSSSFWWNNEDFMSAIIKKGSAPEQKPVIYLDSGNAG